MRALARWAVALLVSAAAFTGTWYACSRLAGLDAGTSWAIAGAVLAAVLAVAGWQAGREPAAAPAPGAATAVTAGDRSPATAGNNTGVIISGDVRDTTITIGAGDKRPLAPAPPPAAGAAR